MSKNGASAAFVKERINGVPVGDFVRRARPLGILAQAPALSDLERRVLTALFHTPPSRKGPLPSGGEPWHGRIDCSTIAPAPLCEEVLRHFLQRHLKLDPHLHYATSTADEILAVNIDHFSYRLNEGKIREMLQIPTLQGATR